MKELSEFGTYVLFGPIDTDSAKSASEFILKASFNSLPVENLLMVVNSPGGDLDAALSLIDIMRLSKYPVHTLALGSVSSAATLITIAGAKGARACSPSTVFMIHQYSWGVAGKHHELMATSKAMGLTHSQLVKFYTDHTKLSAKQVEKHLLKASDAYFSAEEALKLGLVDAIIDKLEGVE